MLARLFHHLAPFQPTLIGSFPLGLQVDGSDLDIACACEDLDAFEHARRTALSDLDIVQPRIERDAFTPTAGYPPELRVDGIRLRDRAWLDFTW